MGRTPQIFEYPGCSTGSFERPRWEIGPNNRLALGLMRASWPAFIIVRFSVERAVGLCPKGTIAGCLWAGPWRRLRRVGAWHSRRVGPPLLERQAQGYARLAAGAHQHGVLPFRPLSPGLRTPVVVPLAECGGAGVGLGIALGGGRVGPGG